MIQSDYVSSAEALTILAVKPQTLYSYVSRGMIRRICVDSRTSLYNREDVRRLKARSTARSGHGAVAAGALQWGEPVLATSITEITSQGPRYRERLALDLAAAGYSYEAVAEYLWTGQLPDPVARWPADTTILRIAPQLAALTAAYPSIHPRQLLTEIVLLLCIEHDQARCGSTIAPPSAAVARSLVQALCMAFGFVGAPKRFLPPGANESIASYLLRAFGVDAGRKQKRVLNAVLVLLADHEFTPATFAARIAASSGVDLYSCIGAALHVHFGSALGLRCDRVEAALQAAATARRAPMSPPNRVPVSPVGFNHPLYANGDPRANRIVELALSLPHEAETRVALQTLQAIDDHHGRLSLDAALVLVCHALGLQGLAGELLALGRSAGWIAHVIEQYQQDFMIRPRGKFTAIASAHGLDRPDPKVDP